MNQTANQIPDNKLIPMVTAIIDRDWELFKEFEMEFTNSYDVETWADVFNFRVLPALDKETKTWVLVQIMGIGCSYTKK